MNEECTDAQVTLAKLRQGALLLTFANEYLCKPPVLTKIGREMERALQALPRQIEGLMSRFPGRLENRDTDRLIAELNRSVQPLGNGEAEISARCGRGDLGRELGLAIADLASAVNTITAQVEGRSPARSSTSGLAALLERATDLISDLSRKFVIVLLPLAAIGALLFGYLFFTMEGDREIRNRIAILEAQAHSSRAVLKEIERQGDQLSRKMASMMDKEKNKELSRSEKIELIDLGQELQGVRDRQIKVETEIQDCGEEIRHLIGRLKEIEKKSLLQRLLRQ